MDLYRPDLATRANGMNRKMAKAVWRLARAFLFYPTAIAVMIWLIITQQHWLWGVGVLSAVLIFDPIYRIILTSILSWRPHKD